MTASDVDAAASRLAGVINDTPLQYAERLSAATGAEVWLKREDLQPVRSYKIRGAYNFIAQLSEEERQAGVIAASAGNHGQGVAMACAALGIKGRIFVPSTTPRQKRDRMRHFGREFVELVVVGDSYDEASAAAKAAAEETGAVVVAAFDDTRTIAGQGTVAKEVVEQLGREPDRMIIPVGGGGLLAGVSTAVKALSPGTALVGVEPAGFDDTLRSLQAGERIVTQPATRSLCDALESPAPGLLTFPVLQKTVADVALVTDAEVAEAMRYAFAVLKLVVEPGGSVGLAALLAGKVADFGDNATGLILSGGNVDPELFARVLRREV